MFNDHRSKRVALIANCIINQNAKVDEYANYPAVVPGIIELLTKYNFGIEQMPCPEMYTAGIRRWWQVSDQYNTAGYRRSYYFLANLVLDCIEDYMRNDFLVVLIGIDGSPTCGVDFTDQDINNEWIGRPSLNLDNIDDVNCFIKKETAPYIAILKDLLKERGLPQIPSIGLPIDIPGERIDLNKVEEFLKNSIVN